MEIANTPIISKQTYVALVKSSNPKSRWEDEIARYGEIHSKQSYVPKGTEYLEGMDMYGYLCDMVIAQTYADTNRVVMSCHILDVIRELDETIGVPKKYIESVHNFIDFKDWIIRKGAIRSYVGELCIIPFNMEDGLLICEGKSNPEWNFSAPHGAGRLFSRSEAKRKLDLGKAQKSMKDKGIYCSSIPLDECKDAYKDAAVIEGCIGPTVTIIDRVTPVMNMKDGK